VEAVISIGERLGVADLEVDDEASGTGLGLGVRDQIGGAVDPDDARSRARRRNREVAGAARDVEHQFPGTEAEPGDECLGGGRVAAPDLEKVTRGPDRWGGGALILLQRDCHATVYECRSGGAVRRRPLIASDLRRIGRAPASYIADPRLWFAQRG